MGDFIHTADTHLGYHQYHRSEREADFATAFTQVIDHAIDRDVDAVVHAGDLFHDSRPSTRTIQTALTQLRRLADANIEFLAVVGNHDGTYDAQWIDIFSELGLAIHLGTDPHTVAGTAFYGIDHIPESQRKTLSYDFTPHDAQHAVLVLHGLVAPLSPHGTWDADQLLGHSPIPFDAVLLGDDHAPRSERIDGTLFTYPGATERTAIDQRRSRVCNVLEIGTGPSPVWIEQIELDTRPHVFLELDLDEHEGEQRVRDALAAEDLTDAVVAVWIEGEGGEITPAALEEYGKQQGALVVRVRDLRELDYDLDAIDVSFADPDAAVQERLRATGLSVVAYEIEQKVRDLDGYPKSTLTERIETEVDDWLETAIDEFDQPADIDEPAANREEFAPPAQPTSDTATEEATTENAAPPDDPSTDQPPDEGEPPGPDESDPEIGAGSAQVSIDEYSS